MGNGAQRIPSWPGATAPTKAAYICADQPVTFTFRLRQGGGPYIPDRPLTARTNHPGNSTRHRDLIDSGQDANRRQSNIHEIIAFEVTAANALGLASLPEEPLDEFSEEEISCFNEARGFCQHQSGRDSFRGAGQHLLSSSSGPVHSDLLSSELRHSVRLDEEHSTYR